MSRRLSLCKYLNTPPPLRPHLLGAMEGVWTLLRIHSRGWWGCVGGEGEGEEGGVGAASLRVVPLTWCGSKQHRRQLPEGLR
jgi:hypothetical protein